MNYFKITCSATIFLLFISSFAYATIDDKEFDKQIKKSFSVGNTPTLEVTNKFGAINIHQGKSGEISIVVDIKVDAKNQEAADNILNEIQIDFSSSSNSVSAETEVGHINSSSGWFGWMKNESISYTVDYDIYVPEATQLELDNAHGDIDIKTDINQCEIELIFGNLTAKNISNNIDLELAHGDARLGNFANGTVEISFSSFECGTINNLDIESQHSDVKIEKANRLISDSSFDGYMIQEIKKLENDGQHDNFNIGSIEELIMEAEFSDLDVEMVHHKTNLDFEHGSIHLKKLGQQFTLGSISSEFSPITISSNVNLDIIIEGTFLDMKLPKNFSSSKMIKEDFDTYIEGKLNVGSISTGKLNLEIDNSNLKIKE
jgi:hypothetical protein